MEQAGLSQNGYQGQITTYIYIYIYTHRVNKYIYMYIYRKRERERERERESYVDNFSSKGATVGSGGPCVQPHL